MHPRYGSGARAPVADSCVLSYSMSWFAAICPLILLNNLILLTTVCIS
jgi:hypothetical protein